MPESMRRTNVLPIFVVLCKHFVCAVRCGTVRMVLYHRKWVYIQEVNSANPVVLCILRSNMEFNGSVKW
jgi:hypothetical protein